MSVATSYLLRHSSSTQPVPPPCLTFPFHSPGQLLRTSPTDGLWRSEEEASVPYDLHRRPTPGIGKVIPKISLSGRRPSGTPGDQDRPEGG